MKNLQHSVKNRKKTKEELWFRGCCGKVLIIGFFYGIIGIDVNISEDLTTIKGILSNFVVENQ